MASESDGTSGPASSGQSEQSPATALTLCPYCGHASASAAECPACGGLFEPLSRQATQNAMGPWFIRDPAQPFRPGCAYATLRTLALKGKLGPESVVRGPSTRQFWMYAKRTPGLAHLLGTCHACKRPTLATETKCSSCGVSFEVATDRQSLGLSDVRLLPGRATAAQIAAGALKGQPVALAPQSSTFRLADAEEPASPSTGVELDAVPIEAPAEPAPVRTVYDDLERPRDWNSSRDDRDEPRAAKRGRTTVLVLASMALVGAMVMLLVFAMLLSQAFKASRATPTTPAGAAVPAAPAGR